MKTSICKLCQQPVIDGQCWEWYHGSYPVGTPEEAKEPVHCRCVAQLTREVLQGLGRVPEAERDQMTFEV